MRTSDAGLVVDALSVRYGPIVAVENVSITVASKSLLAVLGPNGAGKSSLLRGISGLVRTSAGAVHLNGRRVSGLRPHAIARAGIAHVPEGRHVIATLSVEENLLVAAMAAKRYDRGDIPGVIDEVYQLFPRLRERRNQASGLLSGGEQQMLAIGRGLVGRPAVLLLDEPSMGLAPIVIDEIYDILRERPGALKDCAIVLAEQSAALAMDVADHVCVLLRGAVVASGRPSDVPESAVAGAYLGAV